MTEKHNNCSSGVEETITTDTTFSIQLSERVVRVGNIKFQVVSHYCGWEGIERSLGALMLEELFSGEDEEDDEAAE